VVVTIDELAKSEKVHGPFLLRMRKCAHTIPLPPRKKNNHVKFAAEAYTP